MALNLKNPRTLLAIDELARLTGQSKSEAVASAVESRLTALSAEQVAVHSTEARIRALMADTAKRFGQAVGDPCNPVRDLTSDLYDDAGMPR
jgi:hypothetical protein